MKLIWIFILSGLAVSSFSSCSKSQQHDEKALAPLVLASSFPTYCMAMEICHNVQGIEVQSWVPTDISPHDYQLRPQDMQRLQQAALVVRVGLDFEPELDKALQSQPDLPVLTLSSFIRKSDRISSDHQQESTLLHENQDAEDSDHSPTRHTHGSVNPHLWLDPLLLLQMTKGLTQALSIEFPENKVRFENNLAQLESELLKLHHGMKELQTQASSLPFLTQHDAFAYLFKTYQLNWAGMIESGLDWNLSPKQISSILETARQQKVTILFLERGSHQRPPKSLINDLGVQIAELDPMETGSYQPGIFQKTIDSNIKTLARHLTP